MSGSQNISRRRFLFAASAGGATAAAALVVAQKDGVVVQPAISTAPPTGNGYRVTEHIRNYYRTTKV